MKITTIFLFFSILTGLLSQLNAQDSFSISSSVVEASAPTDLSVFYNYTLFDNLTDDTLHMRWVKEVDGGQSHGGGIPLNWNLGIQDPSNYYNPGNGVDSADFVLPPVLNSAIDKLILQVFPNDQVGMTSIKFRIFAIDDPADYVIVTYNYSATSPVTAVNDLTSGLELSVFPNPASHYIAFSNTGDKVLDLALIDPTGKSITRLILEERESKELDCSHLANGTYFLAIKAERKIAYHSILIQKN